MTPLSTPRRPPPSTTPSTTPISSSSRRSPSTECAASTDPPTSMSAPSDPDLIARHLELDSQVALRPEPFGALAYHYRTRRLIFLKHPDIVTVVRSLAAHD